MTGNAQTADAQRRVRLVPVVDEGQRLVRTGIEGTDHDLPPREGLEHGAVRLHLGLHWRSGAPTEVEHLGPEQADTLGLGGSGFECIDDGAHVDQQRDRRSVGGSTGACGRRCGGPGRGARRDAAEDGFRRVDDDLSGKPVYDHLPAALQVRGARTPDDGGDAQLLGEDRGMACGPAELGDESQDLCRIQDRGVRRCEVSSHEDRRGGEYRYARHRYVGQQGDRPEPDVLEIGNPLPEVST